MTPTKPRWEKDKLRGRWHRRGGIKCPYVKGKRIPWDCRTCIHYDPDKKICRHSRAPKPSSPSKNMGFTKNGESHKL